MASKEYHKPPEDMSDQELVDALEEQDIPLADVTDEIRELLKIQRNLPDDGDHS